MEKPEENKNIFDQLETTEGVSPERKNELLAELETIQNTGQIIDFFLDKYIKTLSQFIAKN
jgi:hypothetical protein